VPEVGMLISKLQRHRKIPLGFPKGETRSSFFHSSDSAFLLEYQD